MTDSQPTHVSEKWMITRPAGDSAPTSLRRRRKRGNRRNVFIWFVIIGFSIICAIEGLGAWCAVDGSSCFPNTITISVARCIFEAARCQADTIIADLYRCLRDEGRCSPKWREIGRTVIYFGFWSGITALVFSAAFTVLSRCKRTRTCMADVAIAVNRSQLRWTLFLAGVPCVLNYVAGVVLYAYKSNAASTSLINAVYYSTGSLIVSAGATVLIAYTGWFVFNLTNGFSACRKLVLHQGEQLAERERGSAVQIPMGDRTFQAQAVWERLQGLDADTEVEHTFVYLTALTTEAGIGFAHNFEHTLNKADVVTLTLRPQPSVEIYASEVQTQFQALMRTAKVAPHLFLRGTDSYMRVLEHLTQYRKLVVIVHNMDALTRTHGPEKAKEAVCDRAAQLKSAGYPFVSIIDTTSLPDAETNNAIRITSPNDLLIKLPPKHPDKGQKAGVDLVRAVRRLAIALQPTGLRVKTVYLERYDNAERTGQQRDALKDHGLIRFGSDLIVEALTQVGRAHIQHALMNRFLERLIVSGRDHVAAADLYSDLPHVDRLDLSAALHELTHTRPGARTRESLLEYTEFGSSRPQRFLAFQDRRLAEIAIGRWLAGRRTPYTFSMRRSALCTAAEIYGRLQAVIATPSLHHNAGWSASAAKPRADLSYSLTIVWNEAMSMLVRSAENLGPTALLAAVGALNAVSSLDHEYEFDVSSIADVWDRADLVSRRAFVGRLTETSACRLAKWLWLKASESNDSQTERHSLDRTICRKLGTSGAGTWNGKSVWTTLSETWPDELRTVDVLLPALNWRTKSLYRIYPLNARSLALLGWLLPSLVASTPESARSDIETKLRAVHQVFAAPQSINDLPDIDVGSQIALAEGCRDACYHGLVETTEVPEVITRVAQKLVCDDPPAGLSWYSRLVALQALFVAAAAAQDLSDSLDPDTQSKDEAIVRAQAQAQAEQALETFRAACDRCVEHNHPVVMRYAKILQSQVLAENGRRVTVSKEPHATVGMFTWLDDNQAVSEAGGALHPAVVQILAESVTLLNVSGASEILDTLADATNPGEARINGLTRVDEPSCFKQPVGAARSANERCPTSCEFNLCQPGILDTPVRRELSRTFLERCLHVPKLKTSSAVKQLLAASAAATESDLRTEIAKVLKDMSIGSDTTVFVRGAAGDSEQRLMIRLKWKQAEDLEADLTKRGFKVERHAQW